MSTDGVSYSDEAIRSVLEEAAEVNSCPSVAKEWVEDEMLCSSGEVMALVRMVLKERAEVARLALYRGRAEATTSEKPFEEMARDLYLSLKARNRTAKAVDEDISTITEALVVVDAAAAERARRDALVAAARVCERKGCFACASAIRSAATLRCPHLRSEV